jgi:hypothetical protein
MYIQMAVVVLAMLSSFSTILQNFNPIHPEFSSKKKGRLTLSGATGGTSVAAHGNGHGLGGDVLEEAKSLGQLHTVDGLSGLTGVLEADTQVRAARAGALGLRDLLGGVTDLYRALLVSNGVRRGW